MTQQEKYDALLGRALEAERAYYEFDKPIMSDAEYDAIIRALTEIETETPDIKSPNSPTTRVGGRATNMFEKVVFPCKMLSLKNAFTEEDINNFLNKTTDHAGAGWCIQPKLDGLTLVLFYENHTLVRAATRGNGEVGEDVTLNAMAIRNIPVTINDETLIVRGEVVIHKTEFEHINRERRDVGYPEYANARNVASGSMRQRDPHIAAERHLTFYAYDIPDLQEGTEMQMLARLQKNGFTIPQTLFIPSSFASKESSTFYTIQEVKKNEYSLPYVIDGAVVKTDDRAQHAQLGEGTHDPNWAIAFKFTPIEAITMLKGVIWQLGRTGVLTPVAVLDPVELCGTTVERASLHNISYIHEMSLKLGDMVSVFKAAEIIPQIGKVVESMGGADIPIPRVCPECGDVLGYNSITLRCTNQECRAKIKAEIEYFVSRVALDIRGIATAMISWLVDNGKLQTPADLYKLTKEDLQIPGMSKDLRAEAVLAEIEKSKTKPFDRVLCAIGISGIGTTNAKFFAEQFGSMDALKNAPLSAIRELPGFAEASAQIIYSSLHSENKWALIDALTKAGLQMSQPKVEKASTKLQNMSFCITGTLSQPREQIKKLIEDNGGRCVSSVTASTTYLVAGEGGGSKRDKASSLGVKIITEQQLKELIECQ